MYCHMLLLQSIQYAIGMCCDFLTFDKKAFRVVLSYAANNYITTFYE